MFNNVRTHCTESLSSARLADDSETFIEVEKQTSLFSEKKCKHFENKQAKTEEPAANIF
jgi:hypothetical protein